MSNVTIIRKRIDLTSSRSVILEQRHDLKTLSIEAYENGKLQHDVYLTYPEFEHIFVKGMEMIEKESRS